MTAVLKSESAVSHRVVHLEIPADNPEALGKFYNNLFGWSFKRQPNAPIEYWTQKTASGEADMGIAKRQHPQHPSINYVDVGDIDAAIEKATGLGAGVVMPKKAIPIGYICCLVDPEGNVFGLMQRSG